MAVDRERQAALYEEAMGRPAVERFPPDHPDRWMWDYEGTPAERKRLRRAVLGETDEEPVEQQSLF